MNKVKIFVSIITIFLAVSVYAEDEAKYKSPNVLFNIKPDDISIYWGLNSRYSFSDSKTYLAGAKIGALIDHNFAIGLGAMGLVYPTKTEKFLDSPFNTYYNKTRLYYGGMMLAYYFNPKDLIVFSIGNLVGGGIFRLEKDKSATTPNVNDKFFVVEPEVNIFLNIIQYCRIGVGSSYRFTKGVGTEGLNKKFKDFTVSATVEIGVF